MIELPLRYMNCCIKQMSWVGYQWVYFINLWLPTTVACMQFQPLLATTRITVDLHKKYYIYFITNKPASFLLNDNQSFSCMPAKTLHVWIIKIFWNLIKVTNKFNELDRCFKEHSCCLRFTKRLSYHTRLHVWPKCSLPTWCM